MTGAQWQAEVALALNSMASNDPWYPYLIGDASHPSIATQALNRLIKTAVGGNRNIAGLFPELEDVAADVLSVAGSNFIAYPSNAIVVYELTCARSSVAPDWNFSREFPVVYKDPVTFGYLTKSTTTTGYAKLWTRIGDSIKIWPTPTSIYVDYFRRYFVKKEPTLTAGNSPLMHEDWHALGVNMTVALMLEKLQRFDDAKTMMASVITEIQTAANIQGAEAHSASVSVNKAPTRAMVYGR